jgi:4-hydroxy-2-oxoheptanedioate aldolase
MPEHGGQIREAITRAGVQTVVGDFNDADLADFVGSLGLFSYIWVDMEHSAVPWPELQNISRAADLWGMKSVVRVRANDPSLIALTLGEGVDGIVVPQVNTRADAERVVQAAKFEPIGRRGASYGRKSYNRPRWHSEANDQTFIVIMVESIQGVEALPEILAVPEIDVVFVSHGDLAQSMGLLRNRHHEPAFIEAFDHAIREIVAAGRTAGAAVAEQDIPKYVDMGMGWIKLPEWRTWVAKGGASLAAQVRDSAEQRALSSIQDA